MPALDATRRIFDPVENRFLEIPDNVQFIAAVHRGNEFTGTFSIDAAQLDRFAPLQIDYLPPEKEVELLQRMHPELGSVVERVVEVADAIRKSLEINGGLSGRATDEVCVYLEHPLFADDRNRMLGEVLKSSFCGRFAGRWDEIASEAGAVWSLIQKKVATFRR